MKLSIVVPVYNVAPYLRECLDSLLSQSGVTWEAVCVDDGSTDGSAQILDEYASKDSRFVVIHQNNAGVSAARNVALAHARGDWIAFLDGDDYVLPGLYAEALTAVGVDDDVVGFRVLQVNEDRSECDLQRMKFETACLSGDELLGSVEGPYAGFLTCGWDKIYRREMVVDSGLRFVTELALGEDRLFGLMALHRARGVRCVRTRGAYCYRQRSSSATHRVTAAVELGRLKRLEILYGWFSPEMPSGAARCFCSEAVSVMFLGKRISREVRCVCVEALVASDFFEGKVLPFLSRHADTRMRILANVLRLMPCRVRELVLRKI